MDVLKVSSKSKPNSVAGALANAFKTAQAVEIQPLAPVQLVKPLNRLRLLEVM